MAGEFRGSEKLFAGAAMLFQIFKITYIRNQFDLNLL
jgi:hypothetical protein